MCTCDASVWYAHTGGYGAAARNRIGEERSKRRAKGSASAREGVREHVCGAYPWQMRAGRAFSGFQEASINFAPTFKYDVGTQARNSTHAPETHAHTRNARSRAHTRIHTHTAHRSTSLFSLRSLFTFAYPSHAPESSFEIFFRFAHSSSSLINCSAGRRIGPVNSTLIVLRPLFHQLMN